MTRSYARNHFRYTDQSTRYLVLKQSKTKKSCAETSQLAEPRSTSRVAAPSATWPPLGVHTVQQYQEDLCHPYSPPDCRPLLAQPLDHYLKNRHTCGVQLRHCAYSFEGQLSAIPPNSARIESPSATMSPSKQVVNDVRHKERYRREVMHAAFEAPVCGPKHERGYSLLRRS